MSDTNQTPKPLGPRILSADTGLSNLLPGAGAARVTQACAALGCVSNHFFTWTVAISDTTPYAIA